MYCMQDTVTYELIGDPDEVKALEYFFVTPVSGVLHLKKSLMDDEGRDTTYQVS